MTNVGKFGQIVHKHYAGANLLDPNSGSTQVSRIKRCLAARFNHIGWAKHHQWSTKHVQAITSEGGQPHLLSASYKQKDRHNFIVLILNAHGHSIGAGYPGFDQMLFINNKGTLRGYFITDPYQQDVDFVPMTTNIGKVLDEVLTEIDPSQKILENLLQGRAQIAAD